MSQSGTFGSNSAFTVKLALKSNKPCRCRNALPPVNSRTSRSLASVQLTPKSSGQVPAEVEVSIHSTAGAGTVFGETVRQFPVVVVVDYLLPGQHRPIPVVRRPDRHRQVARNSPACQNPPDESSRCSCPQPRAPTGARCDAFRSHWSESPSNRAGYSPACSRRSG